MQKTLSTLLYFIAGIFAPPRATEEVVAELTVDKLQALALYSGALPYHEHAVRALVWELKYRGSARAQALAGEYLADLLLAEAEDTIGTLLLVPVPMHQARRKQRGHNQTELLCEAALKFLSVSSSEPARKKVLGGSQTIFSNGLASAPSTFSATFAGGFEYNPNLLIRTIDTKTQQGLERHERLHNVKKSMEVMHPELVQGRVCVVIDDVTTTGATFAEAKRALRAAGASEVRCIALAHS